MTLTAETFDRFWRSMAERYGSRWLESYGDKPTHAWRETLRAFTPKDISRAIGMLSEREDTKQFPPTEPAFKALLQQAVRMGSKPADDANELRRTYWRSTIVHAVAAGLGYSVEAFEPVLVAHRDRLGYAMRELLDEVDALEAATGQRTTGQERHVALGCFEIIARFSHLRPKRAAA